ncbi:cyclic nucleotide-binding/CBS domain-containing protein [Halomicrobium salinisoli]|uniref:CBS domain-containing protein n=1 Tax=Halomicrobium salinisoli TaxID=2878391 RepID=UPI001CF08ABA|nr:CBS domain-containing protein [Halomicrobium salinisoli]
MSDIFVSRLMTADPLTVSPDTFVEEAANVLQEEDIGSLLVAEDGDLVGILTTTDFVDIVAASKPKAETTVERYMSTDLTTVTAQITVEDAAELMIEEGIHHLPVVDDDGAAIGILTTTDLTNYVSNPELRSPA